jgi:hypothetical protein
MRPVESPLLNLPGDLLILILKHFTLLEFKNFQEFLFSVFPPNSFSQNPPSLLAQSLPTNPRTNLLRLFNHCGGQLFHNFYLSSNSLDWLRRLSVRLTKINFLDFDTRSFEYFTVYKESVTEIDFYQSIYLTNKALNEIGRSPFLTSLSLHSAANINDNGLQRFLKSNPQIKALDLSATMCFSVNIIPSLRSCQNLQYLDVSGSRWFSDECLMNLNLSSFPQLIYFGIYNTLAQIPSVIAFLKSNPHLRSIHCYLCPEMQTLDHEDKCLFLRVALRSLLRDDFRELGLCQLSFFMKTDDGRLFELIRSVGATKCIVDSLSHSVITFISFFSLFL